MLEPFLETFLAKNVFTLVDTSCVFDVAFWALGPEFVVADHANWELLDYTTQTERQGVRTKLIAFQSLARETHRPVAGNPDATRSATIGASGINIHEKKLNTQILEPLLQVLQVFLPLLPLLLPLLILLLLLPS